jgi:hypothetical protein
MYKPEGDPIQIRYFERRAQEIVGSGLSSCRPRSPRCMPRERRLALIERLGGCGMLDRYHLFTQRAPTLQRGQPRSAQNRSRFNGWELPQSTLSGHSSHATATGRNAPYLRFAILGGIDPTGGKLSFYNQGTQSPWVLIGAILPPSHLTPL